MIYLWGELGLNTYDGKVYIQKDSVGIGSTVIVVNPWSVGLGSDTYNTFFTTGNVGIGSTIPTSSLTVTGDAIISGVVTATAFFGNGSGITGISAGSQGTQGLQGLQGVQGLSNQGVQGLQGTVAAQGTQGLQGLSNQGVQGTQGLQGRQGVQGLSNQGVQGTQGTVAAQGTQGLQGLSNQGVQGTQDTAGANSLTTAQIYNGAAKAWVNFNGAFGTSPFTTANGGICASFNVSSITDNNIGDYTITFTNAMVDANYSTQLMGGRIPNDTNSIAVANISSQTAPTTSTIRIRTINPIVAYADYDHISVVIFR